MLAALVVVLFYLKFLRWMSLFVLCVWILVIFILVWALKLIFLTLGPGFQPRQHTPLFTRANSDAFWTGGLYVGHDNLSMAVFILIYRSHPYRRAVVPRFNYLILAIEPNDSYAQGLVRHGVEPSEGLSARLYVHHAASRGFRHFFLLPTFYMY